MNKSVRCPKAGIPSIRVIASGLFLFVSCSLSLTFAQVSTSIVADSTLPSGSNSIVPSNNGRIDISGGLSVGSNLFHSFSDFQVGSGDSANFLSRGASNILSRVTGNNPSNIFGTIGVDIGEANQSNANLFFLNPNGVVFGPNASLDLNGSFHVSTADQILLGEGNTGGLFSALNPSADILSSAPPSAFGFTGNNPLSSIEIDRATLTVTSGNVISIIGADSGSLPNGETESQILNPQPGIVIRNSKVAAPQGLVNLLSVASTLR